MLMFQYHQNNYKFANGYKQYLNSDLYFTNCNQPRVRKTYKSKYYFDEEFDNKILREYENIDNDIIVISKNNDIKTFEVVSILVKHKIIKYRHDARGYDKYKETEEYKSKIKNIQ